MLARLAVFAGPFTLEAAEAVAAAWMMAALDAGPLVVTLADKSLLQVDATRAARTIQDAAARARVLPGAPGSGAARPRCARRTVRTTSPSLSARRRCSTPRGRRNGSRRSTKISPTSARRSRAASRTTTPDALADGYRDAPVLGRRGLAGEGIELLAATLDRPTQAMPSRCARRPTAPSRTSPPAGSAMSAPPSRTPSKRLRLARASATPTPAAEALIWLSWSESFAGRASEGLARAQEALQNARSITDPTVLGRLLDAEAIALEQLGDTSATRLAYERAREVFAQAGYAPGVASVENHLGNLDLSAGDLSAAAAHFSLARTTAEAAGDGASVAMAALNLALVDHLEGRRESARELFVDALITNQACGDRANIAFSIFGLAADRARRVARRGTPRQRRAPPRTARHHALRAGRTLAQRGARAPARRPRHRALRSRARAGR